MLPVLQMLPEQQKRNHWDLYLYVCKIIVADKTSIVQWFIYMNIESLYNRCFVSNYSFTSPRDTNIIKSTCNWSGVKASRLKKPPEGLCDGRSTLISSHWGHPELFFTYWNHTSLQVLLWSPEQISSQLLTLTTASSTLTKIFGMLRVPFCLVATA